MFSQKVCKEYGTAMSLIALVWLSVLFALGACNSTSQIASQPSTENASGLESNSTVIVPTPEVASETHIPMPTATVNTELTPLSTEPVTTSSQTPQPVLETKTAGAILPPTFEPELAKVTGYLFVYNRHYRE
jgi:hypothetical protein